MNVDLKNYPGFTIRKVGTLGEAIEQNSRSLTVEKLKEIQDKIEANCRGDITIDSMDPLDFTSVVTVEKVREDVYEFQRARAECARNNGVKHCVFLTKPAPEKQEPILVLTLEQIRREVDEFQQYKQNAYASQQ